MCTLYYLSSVLFEINCKANANSTSGYKTSVVKGGRETKLPLSYTVDKVTPGGCMILSC